MLPDFNYRSLLAFTVLILTRRAVMALTPISSSSGHQNPLLETKQRSVVKGTAIKARHAVLNPNSQFHPLDFVRNIVEQVQNRTTMKDRDTTLLQQTSQPITEWSKDLEKTKLYCQLADLVYVPTDEALQQYQQALVDMGTTENIRWMVTDSISNSRAKTTTRTITIRGFDSSDESVDREGLWRTVCCSSQPRPISLPSKGRQEQQPVLVHSGLFEIAQTMYETKLKPLLLEATSNGSRIVICGHSIGGAMSTLLLLLITMDQGPEFVRQHIDKVYAFGAPPVAGAFDIPKQDGQLPCPVLQAFGLPSELVHGYVQPWDPVARIFTKQDPVYQLVVGNADLTPDVATTLAAGRPFRLLCWLSSFVLPKLSWWPEYRESILKNSSHQAYIGVGYQHVFVPIQENLFGSPMKQIIHRFTESTKFYPALAQTFPLEASEMAHVLPAIRSFSSHSSAIYSKSLETFMEGLKKDLDRRQER